MQNELPRKFLGVSVKNPRKAQILEYLISAVSGTNATEVHTVLADITSRFSGQPFAKAADTALAKMGQPVARKKEPAANDSVTLSGDLALFGLPNVLQNLSDTKVTGAVKIFSSDGGEMAEIRLADGNLISAVLGKLKNAWDLQFSHNSELILILSGSLSLWIDDNILNSTAFFGRVSLQLKLDELSLKECRQFWGGQYQP